MHGFHCYGNIRAKCEMSARMDVLAVWLIVFVVLCKFIARVVFQHTHTKYCVIFCQKLLSETVVHCEDTCKQQIKEAIDSERASLADDVQKQVFVLCPVTIETCSCIDLQTHIGVHLIAMSPGTVHAEDLL